MSSATKSTALANLKARRQQAASGGTGSEVASPDMLPGEPAASPPPSTQSCASASPSKAPTTKTGVPEPSEDPGPLPTREVEAFAWVCGTCQRECVPVRSESRCLCGHRLREHDPASSKAPSRCKSAKCGCRGFFFIVAEGSWVLRCRCKHKHVEHDATTHACAKAGCSCGRFDSPWVCNCDHPWGDHKQLVRAKQVVSVRDMLGAMSLAEVGGGGPAREVNDYTALKRGDFGAQQQ